MSHYRNNKIFVTLYGEKVDVTNKAKFLGVTFDSTLSFTFNVDDIAARSKKRINLLKAVTGTNWGANSTTILTLYKQFVRPVLEYGFQAICIMPAYYQEFLQKIQNCAIKNCATVAFVYPNSMDPRDVKHRETHRKMEDTSHELSSKYFKNESK